MHDAVDEVLVFPRAELESALHSRSPLALLRTFSAFRSELRSRRFDLVVDFHSILKSALLARLSGAPLRVGYAPPFGREASWLFHNRLVRPGRAPISRFDRNAALVDAVEVLLGAGARTRSGMPESTHEFMIEPRKDALARMAARTPAVPFALIHPGSSPGTEYKRYAPSGYAKVAMALREDPGIHTLVACGPAPEERTLAEQVVDAAEGAAALAPETGCFEDFAALLGLARVYIGSDSGPLHLSSLLGTPVVQIMGPTHPIENEPYSGTPWRRARVPLACSPCRRGCLEAVCMEVIAPGEVARAARELLGHPSGAALGARRDPASGCHASGELGGPSGTLRPTRDAALR